MASPTFRFKQFTIRHDRSAMKVGTDGVLLGAWASQPRKEKTEEPERILDVGTGTGLIALMLAQRFPSASILGIDIDKDTLTQAKENVEASPFSTQISIEEHDFSDLDGCFGGYDLIVSNPPFYQEDTLGGNAPRDAARHTVSLPFETLVGNTSKLLMGNGHFCVIIPFQCAEEFISICAQHQLYLQRRLDVRSSLRKPFKRALLEFGSRLFATERKTLTLYDEANQRTPAYAQLTQDFYL